MVDLGFADWLSLAQTAGIVLSLGLTLYFARRQIQAMKVDIETRVLNDLDEKRYRLSEIFLDKPEYLQVVAQTDSGSEPRHVIAYMTAQVSAHAFNMRQRGILSDNEWLGWEAWIRNDFAQGTLGADWKRLNMARWFDPQFGKYVDEQVLGRTAGSGKIPQPS